MTVSVLCSAVETPVGIVLQHAEFSEELKEYLDDSGLKNVRHLESLVQILFYILGMFLACSHF